MTNETFPVYCCYCDNSNEINLNDYEGHDLENLVTICDTCGNHFGFDVEINYLTHVFPLSSLSEDAECFFRLDG